MPKLTGKIRVRLESFNHELMTLSCQKILTLLQTTSVQSFSLVSLPTQTRRYCVLRSPHVDKDSREHFEIRTHKRMLDIYSDAESSVLGLLAKADLPSGVLYSICFC